MKYTFKLTEQEYLDFNVFTINHVEVTSRQKKMVRYLFTITPLGTGLVFWVLEGKAAFDFTNLVLFVFMLILTLLFWNYSPKLYDRLILSNAKKILLNEGRQHIICERETSFEENGIQHKTEYEETLTKYSALTDIKQSDKALYLYTSPVTAIILPLRIFTTKEEEESLVAFLKTKRNIELE